MTGCKNPLIMRSFNRNLEETSTPSREFRYEAAAPKLRVSKMPVAKNPAIGHLILSSKNIYYFISHNSL